MVLGKLSPSPNSNANLKPNPDPDRGPIFLGGNFSDTEQITVYHPWEKTKREFHGNIDKNDAVSYKTF